MSSVVACPTCKQNLTLPPELAGQTVRCPVCANTFVVGAAVAAPAEAISGQAMQANAPPPLPKTAVPAEELAAPLEEEIVFDVEVEDDDRPRRRNKPSKGGGYYGELLRKQRRMQARHRGGLVLIMGILSVVFSWACLLAIGACICGYYAYQWGSYDLREMEADRMDRTGQGLTRAGWIIGIVGMILSVPGITCTMLYLVGSLVRAARGPGH